MNFYLKYCFINANDNVERKITKQKYKSMILSYGDEMMMIMKRVCDNENAV